MAILRGLGAVGLVIAGLAVVVVVVALIALLLVMAFPQLVVFLAG